MLSMQSSRSVPLLHQGGLSPVSIASHVNTADSKKHLGAERSLYHSFSRKRSLEVGGWGRSQETAGPHTDRLWPVGGSIDAVLVAPYDCNQ